MALKRRNIKVFLIFFTFLAFSSILILRLYSLQIKKGDYFSAIALGQQFHFEEVTGKRGGIFFNNGVVLAKTERKYILYIFPNKIPPESSTSTLAFLAKIISEDQDKLSSLFKTEKLIKIEISKQEAGEIDQKNIQGVYTDAIWARSYPQQELASHLVGFTNQQGEGQYGIEGYYNRVLNGSKSFESETNSPFGYLNILTKPVEQENLKGTDIYLTIDYNLQYFAEKILAEAYEDWKIDSGQVIISQPNTGKILALASFPNFNPNKYSKKKNMEIFLNPVIQKLYEPGSVFKPITMAAGLEEHLVEPDTVYEDKGYVKIVGPPIYNFHKKVWGKQSMTNVLEESINTGAVFVEQKLGEDMFLSRIRKFGFFEKTEIDLEGEDYSENKPLMKKNPRDVATASFGQGINITPIQLVRAFGAIANGGNLMRPFMVERIVKADGEIIKTKPKIQRKVISRETSNKLTTMLISVVQNRAARRAQIKNYYIAGKTGTAQMPKPQGGGYYKDRTIQSFIGFLPAFNPRILIYVKLDNPKKVYLSAYSAAPLFRKIAKYAIDYYQIPPDHQEP